ncbi:alpha/beta fold hydrolase [Desulfolithobacter sp.]
MVEMLELAGYPFRPKRYQLGDGAVMSYVDEGLGDVVVMVHGNPSWSYLYRDLVSALAPGYRCIAPDHIGCGLSDKPQDYPYRLSRHIENLEALLDHLDVRRCVLVVHDWGGAIGLGWAGRHADRVRGVVVLNTAAFLARRIPLRISLCRMPLFGAFIVRGLNGFAWPATSMAVCRKMEPDVKKGFLYPYDSWQSRVGIHRFVQDIPLHPRHPSWETLVAVEQGLFRLVDKPMQICWGGRDFCFNRFFYREWRRRFPAARARYFPEAGHYVLEDAGEEIIPLVQYFLMSCHD